MKRLVHVLAVVILMASVGTAFAAQKATGQPGAAKVQAKAKVDCCIKGKCTKADSAEQCMGAGGKVVKSCAECK